jgi:membrane glycosyltransferase
VIVGDDTAPSALRYFTVENPLLPIWPDMPFLSQAMLAAAIVITLLIPKIIGAVDFIRRGGVARGQVLPFVASMLTELMASILCAPMMMVQHVRAVLRSFAGFDTGWVPHSAGRPRIADLLRFHATETVLGAGLLGMAAFGWLSLWLLPIAICLLFAAPASYLLAINAQTWPLFRIGAGTDHAGGRPMATAPSPKAS